MILIRPQIESDGLRLAQLGYIPKESDVSAVVEIDGVPRMAAMARKTSEIYLVIDPSMDKRERLGLLLALHKELPQPMLRAGFTDAHCWTNDPMFGKVLMHLNWRKPLWACYHLEIK
jgi:hypothetical protein